MSQFTWTDFYIETAQKLMDYETERGRAQLLEFLREVEQRGHKTVRLTDKDASGADVPLADIDPFTFFANFNRGTTEAGRLAICREVKRFLNVTADVPSDFDGIPVVNNIKSWFFPYAINREDWHIQALWDIAADAVNGSVSAESFDRCLGIPHVNKNLTMGLFWLNPTAFLSVDAVMMTCLGHKLESPFSYAVYQKALAAYRSQYGQSGFVEVSHQAWLKSVTNYWVFNANPDQWDVFAALANEDVEVWTVNQHAADITPGDKFVLYVTGTQSGVYGVGTVTSEVEEVPDVEGAERYQRGEADDGAKPRVAVKVDLNLHAMPILKKDLDRDPKLAGAPFGKQGTNLALEKKAFNRLKKIADARIERAEQGEESVESVHESASGYTADSAGGEARGDSRRRMAKNLILYGPPGTGKTYSVVNHSLAIIDGRDPSVKQSAADRERYRELQQGSAAQIEFVTFHQSFSYEDFVEGIRPSLSEEESADLAYRLVPGVFRRMAERARKNYENSRKSVTELATERTAEQVLADFADHVRERLDEGEYRINDKVYVMEVDEGAFRYTGEAWNRHQGGIRMKFSDLIAMYKARVSSRQEVKELEELSGLAQQHATYYLLMYQHMKAYEAAHQVPAEGAVEEQRKEYVLVIDEINRGNVSRVLGELITLIEPDKRIGERQETWVQLPYSHERFALPPNLHIVGTMNTADRSLAALDTALRRRFEFEEMLPEASLLQETEDGIDLRRLLERINARIEALIDRDHLIGHAWLMDVGDVTGLRNAFQHRIVPLLQEYFFDDLSRIAMVLESSYEEGVLTKVSSVDLGWKEHTAGERYRVNPRVLAVPAFYIGIYEDAGL